jgi:hypothetical protein
MTLVNDPNQRNGWQSILLQAADYVSLAPSTYSMIEQRYRVLKSILDGASDPLLHDAHVLPQGSIRGRTAIRPPAGATGSCATVDADAVIWLPNATSASAATVLKAVQDRFEEKSRVEEPVQELRRGIRIVYADENPGFHIDITPARNVAGNQSRDGHGNLVVTDRRTGWKESTPIGYADWLNAVADLVVPVMAIANDEALRKRVILAEATQEEMPGYDEYVDANPLRATIKLLKRHRDLWGMRQATDAYKPISAIITTLAGLSYADVARDAAVRQRTPLDAMLEIVGGMPDYIDGYEGNWQILNPADAGENFAEKWNRDKGEGARYRAGFYAWHGEAMRAFELGLSDLGTRDVLSEQMRGQFGIPSTLVEGVTDSLPGNWAIPGMGAGKTRNQIAAAGLAGAGVSSGSSQASANSLGRLG